MDNLETAETNGYLHLDDVALDEHIDSALEASLLNEENTDVIESILAESIKKPKTFVSNGKEGSNSSDRANDDLDLLLSRIDTYVGDFMNVQTDESADKSSEKNDTNKTNLTNSEKLALEPEYPYSTQDLVCLLRDDQNNCNSNQTSNTQQDKLKNFAKTENAISDKIGNQNTEIDESLKKESNDKNDETSNCGTTNEKCIANGIIHDELSIENTTKDLDSQIQKTSNPISPKEKLDDIEENSVDNYSKSIQEDLLISTQEFLTLVDSVEKKAIVSVSEIGKEENKEIREVSSDIDTAPSSSVSESASKSILSEVAFKDTSIKKITPENTSTNSEIEVLEETASIAMEYSAENGTNKDPLVDPLQDILENSNIGNVQSDVDCVEKNCDTADKDKNESLINSDSDKEKNTKTDDKEEEKSIETATSLNDIAEKVEKETAKEIDSDRENGCAPMGQDIKAIVDANDIIEIFDDSPAKVNDTIEEEEEDIIDQNRSTQVPSKCGKTNINKLNQEVGQEKLAEFANETEIPETLLKILHEEENFSKSPLIDKKTTMGSKPCKSKDTSNLEATVDAYDSDDDVMIIDHVKEVNHNNDEISKIDQKSTDDEVNLKNEEISHVLKSDLIENVKLNESEKDAVSETVNEKDTTETIEVNNVDQSIEAQVSGAQDDKNIENKETNDEKNKISEEHQCSPSNDDIVLLDDEDSGDRSQTKAIDVEPNEESTTPDNDKVKSIDKESENECPEAVTVSEIEKPEESNLAKSKSTEKASPPLADDAIVLLDDDDEENIVEKKIEGNLSENKVEVAASKPNCDKSLPAREEGVCGSPITIDVNEENINSETNENLVPDTSDNACDASVASEKIVNNEQNTLAKNVENDDGVSNCSSSSNLLQESQLQSRDQEETVDDDDEGDDNDDDVQFIEDLPNGFDAAKTINSEPAPPPSKKIRLSVDGEQSPQAEGDIEISVESTKVGNESTEKVGLQKEKNSEVDGTSPTTKRPHSLVEESDSEKSENATENGAQKKLKTIESVSETPKGQEETSKMNDVSKSDDGKQVLETIVILDDVPKEDNVNASQSPIKPVETVVPGKPIALYPPPQFNEKSEPLDLEILKLFKKNFRNMTKHDLEQLILQKIVEAIIFKSEFSKMNETMEKLEKIIVAQRTKIEEVSKQFRDLEMVHNRVVKELETRNANTVLPVKITRAVGLQVSFPYRNLLDNSAPAANSVSPAAPTSFRNLISKNNSARVTPTENIPPQPNSMSTATISTAALIALQSSGSRKAVLQKSTSRVVDPSTNTLPTVPTSGVAQIQVRSSAQLMPVPPVGSPSSGRSNKTTVTPPIPAVVVGRSKASPQDSSRPYQSSTFAQQQKVQPLQGRQTSQPLRRIAPRLNNGNGVAQQQIQQQQQQSQQPLVTQSHLRRTDPLPQLPGATIKSQTSAVQQYTVSQSVSITTARPKVIDLTDEDDASSSVATNMNTVRRSLPGQNYTTANNNNSSAYLGNRPTPPLLRFGNVPNQVNPSVSGTSAIAQRKQIPAAGQKIANYNNSAIQSITTPAGTSITRVQISTANPPIPLQRARNVHPAPLPATPSQPHNSGWKLPPQRPLIRISNIDKGIVISWTLEEPATTRHAECVSYQIYAYQETNTQASTDMWRCVGDVKAMLLPMAVTLTQFQEGQRYYFAVRAVDVYNRVGPFSLPKTWA